MCGRFAQIEPAADIIKTFFIDELLVEPRPSYNIAPGQDIAAIVSDGDKRILTGFKWGLVPYWAKDPSIGYRMINARAETVCEKPSFSAAFKARRCLIPVSGFFEWQKKDNARQPYFIRLAGGGPFAFAGLHEKWVSGDTEILSCTIITTEANDLLKPLHDRMPVILPRQKGDIWLDMSTEPEEALTLLIPYQSEEMEYFPVSTAVNSPKNNSPECITPIEGSLP